MAASDLSDQQQKKIALDLVLDAWDSACQRGVSSDMLAEVLLYLALTDLVADRGEDFTAQLLESLPNRVRDGEFTLDKPAPTQN